MKILVVDDDPRIRAMTAAALVAHGHDVIEAESGDAALARLEADTQLLVSDVLMPGMRGPDLARAARARLPQLRVLFISGDVGDTPRAAFDGAPLLAKPFTAAALAEAVVQVMA